MDTCLIANDDEDPCSAYIDSTTLTTPQFMADLSAWTSSLAQEADAAPLACFPDTTLEGDELHRFDNCFCVDLVIAANAKMQVKVVWATLNGRGTSSIDDMLQCQKNVLASCEALLGCRKCSLKSDYVVLVICMCQEMVNGVKALQVIISRFPNSDSEISSKAKLEAGGWRLDDDDEIDIITHLIQVRTTKLKKLISQLEQVVRANHASYTWIVSTLRQSIDDKLGSTESRSDDIMVDLNG